MLIAGKEEDGPNLGSPVYSTPVVANGVIYVASNAHLYAIHDAARHAPTSDQPKVDVNPKDSVKRNSGTARLEPPW